MAYADQAPNKAPAPVRADAVSSTVNRLYDQANTLSELCIRAEAIAGGLDGPAQQTTGNAGDKVAPGKPPHLVGSLEYFHVRLDSLLGDLRGSINRIESALG